MIRNIWLAGLALFATPVHADIPSIPSADAPELAALGPNGVGFRSVLLTHKNQPDVENGDTGGTDVPLVDRILRVDIWYPETVKSQVSIAEVYGLNHPSRRSVSRKRVWLWPTLRR